MKVEFTSRYEALGIPYPDPNTMCHAGCVGTGWLPIKRDETNPILRKLWQEAEDKNPTDDAWHFVKCPKCGGTGKTNVG